ncbi:solute carrier family 35 member E1-like [Oscarella lobularis]|uniref:solute carrier family 35 member E1-like n=1 Tax=Oscarella lobularis TaxID=121494 RepID=UPI0033144C2B
MTARRDEIIRISSLCLFWYLISSSANVTNKTFFKAHGLPITVSLAQLVSNAVYVNILLRLWRIPASSSLASTSFYARKLAPLALVKLMVTTMSNISVSRVSVSYAHTVKALLPFFTVVLSRIILKERPGWKVYLSLVPIVAGVMLATITELSFDSIGLISALLCGFFLAFQSVFSKKILIDSDIHRFHLLLRLTQLAVLFVFPFWLWSESGSAATKSQCDYGSSFQNPVCSTFLFTLFLSGALNFFQNVVAFTVLASVTSLSYAVANNVKRIVVIAVSIAVLHNPVTLVNVAGMTVAVLGALLYNKFQYEGRRSPPVLPLFNRDDVVKNGAVI